MVVMRGFTSLLKTFRLILRKFASYIDLLNILLVVIGLVGLIMLSFYFDFGFKTFEIKSIYTPDTGLLSINIDLMYCLSLVFIFVFYIGYRLSMEKRPFRGIRIPGRETKREMIIKYLLSILLVVIGLWVLYDEFSKPLMWGYYLTQYTKISRVSYSQRIASVIALFLLLNWFLVLEIRVRLERKES